MENASPIPNLEQQVQDPKKKSPANWIIGVVVGAVVVAVILVVAALINRLIQTAPQTTQQTSQTVSPTLAPDEEAEANAVDPGNVEQDLQDVQKDVDAL